MEIKDKVAVVTGASAGIGLALVHELSKRGAKVVLAARSVDALKTLEKETPNSLAVPTDMRKPEDIVHLMHEAKEKFGRIDILINNAGQGMRSPLESIDMKVYREVMELNVFSVVEAMQAVIPVMRARERLPDGRQGFILNVSSMVSKNYYPGLAAYSSTKYALNSLSLTARQELAPDNIIVSVFHPKMTATDFGKNSAGEKYDSKAGRPGMSVDTAEEVAVQIANQIESEEAEANM